MRSVAHEWQDAEGDLPSFVAMNGGAPGGGFLGLNFDPYVIGNLDAPLDNLNLPDGVDDDRLSRRLKALEVLNNRFGQKGDLAKVTEHKKATDKALRCGPVPRSRRLISNWRSPRRCKPMACRRWSPKVRKHRRSASRCCWRGG